MESRVRAWLTTAMVAAALTPMPGNTPPPQAPVTWRPADRNQLREVETGLNLLCAGVRQECARRERGRSNAPPKDTRRLGEQGQVIYWY